jgi:hypothetical protein
LADHGPACSDWNRVGRRVSVSGPIIQHGAGGVGSGAMVIQRGCEQDRLVFYLNRIPNVSQLGMITRRQLDRDCRDLSRAAKRIVEYEASVLQPWLDGEAGFHEIPVLLNRVVAWLRTLQPQVHGRSQAAVDDILASIVRHVFDRTGHFHDSTVCDLVRVSAPRGRLAHYHIDKHRPWRRYHRELLTKPTYFEHAWASARLKAVDSRPYQP